MWFSLIMAQTPGQANPNSFQKFNHFIWEREILSFLQMPNIFICVASDPLDLISEGKVMRRLVAHVIFTQYQDWKGAPSSYILYGFQTRKRNYFCHMQSLKGSNLTTCNLCLYLLTLHWVTNELNLFLKEIFRLFVCLICGWVLRLSYRFQIRKRK